MNAQDIHASLKAIMKSLYGECYPDHDQKSIQDLDEIIDVVLRDSVTPTVVQGLDEINERAKQSQTRPGFEQRLTISWPLP